MFRPYLLTLPLPVLGAVLRTIFDNDEFDERVFR